VEVGYVTRRTLTHRRRMRNAVGAGRTS
jgi:hypothetical protein